VTVVDLADATPQPQPLGCPVEVAERTTTFTRGGHGTLRVTCPNGCSGPVLLFIDGGRKQMSTHEINRYIDRVNDARVAVGALHVPVGAGPQRVAVKLLRPAIALLRRHHRRLRVTTYLGLDPTGPELAHPSKPFVIKLRR
jgi:hypothetical protein